MLMGAVRDVRDAIIPEAAQHYMMCYSSGMSLIWG